MIQVFKQLMINDKEKNSLLFEISDKVFLNSNLNKIYKNFTNKNWCYYNYFSSNLVENNKYIVQNSFGNIAFFIQSSKEFESNVDIKVLKFFNNDKVVLLAFASKKIFKNDILISNKKLVKI